MDKTSLRAFYKAQRLAFSATDLLALQQQIFDYFQAMCWNDVHYVHLFLPILSQREVNTMPWIGWLEEHHPDLVIVVSVSNFKTLSMDHYRYGGLSSLRENRWGIPEPLGGATVAPALLDRVMVPMLVCDLAGHRVGYGKGFYDRFLALCRPDCHKVGVSYVPPIAAIDDVNPFDVALDACISPQGYYTFKK